MYQTGTATSATNLLQTLATFATSAGWTVNNNAAEAGGWWLSLVKGSTYINLWVDTTGNVVNCYGATGFALGSGHAGQANTSPANACNLGVGPFTGYHFFSATSGANYLHVVVEISAGVFRHIQVGSLQPIGGASPCTYIEASVWSTSTTANGQNYPDSTANYTPWGQSATIATPPTAGCMAATVDGIFRWFSLKNAAPGRKVAQVNVGGILNNAVHRSPNAFNGLTPLFSVSVMLERSSGSVYSYVGDVPDMRICSINNVNPKDEITIGSDVWKIFPSCAKNSTVNTVGAGPSSGPYAFAYKKNA